MVSFTDEQKYYLYPYPMDMRKDIDSLSDIVREEMCLDPSRLNGVFIFISKKRNIMNDGRNPECFCHAFFHVR